MPTPLDKPWQAFYVDATAIMPFVVKNRYDYLALHEFYLEAPVWLAFPSSSYRPGQQECRMTVNADINRPFSNPCVAWSVDEAVKMLEEHVTQFLATCSVFNVLPFADASKLKSLDYPQLLKEITDEMAVRCGVVAEKDTYISPFTGKRV